MKKRRGFTLLEVMVAVAILGVGITAILAAQWGAVRTVSEARNLSEANALARCKMSELEAQVAREGFVDSDFSETGPCCDNEEHPRITCTWHIAKPVFPEAKFGELNLDAELDLAGSGEKSAASPGGGTSALSQLTKAQKGDLGLPEGNVGDIAQALTGDVGNVTDGITDMALGIVYPDLKAVFESGTRKISVVATWPSGGIAYQVELVQWTTNARVAGLSPIIPGEGEEGEESNTGSTGSGGSKIGSGNDLFKPRGGRN